MCRKQQPKIPFPCSSLSLAALVAAASNKAPRHHKRRQQSSSGSKDRDVLRLFLGSLGLGRVAGALLLLAQVAGLGSRVAELAVSTALDGLGEVGLRDLGEAGGGLLDGEGGGEGLDGLGLGEVDLGVALLDLVGAAGEDDEALLVGLEAGDVGGQGLLAQVLAAAIDGDTDGGSVKAGDTGGLVDSR